MGAADRSPARGAAGLTALKTPRLRLRELREEDAQAAFAWAGDPDCARYMSWDAATSPDGTREFIRGVVAHARLEPRLNYELGVEEADGGLLVGNCRLTMDRGSAASIGYVYRRDRWGRGYGTEVLIALIKFGFDELGLHRLWATAHVENQGSWRVMEKAGMRREGRLRDALQMSGGWADTYLYSILEVDPRPDFR